MRSPIPELFTDSKQDPQKTTNIDSKKANILGRFFSSVYLKEPDWTYVFSDDEKPIIKKKLKSTTKSYQRASTCAS